MSRKRQTTIACSKCNAPNQFTVWESVNVTLDPKLKRSLLTGTLNIFTCQHCGGQTRVEHNCLYHDMDKSMMIWLQKEETKEVKLARDMLSPLQPMSVTRIVRHYYELMDKITVFDAGFDDFEMELFKFGVCIRENIDLTTPFYFTELESPFLGRKKLLFLLERHGNPEIVDFRLSDYETVIKKMGPMVRRYVAESALQWAHVNRLFVLGIMEEAGLMTPANAPSSTNSHPSEEPVKRTKVAKDPLHKQAEKLVPAAAINATSMFVPVLEKFPFLSETDVEHWDFIVTVAGVFMGASRLNNMRIGDAREEELMETVAVSLDNWNPDGIRGFEDCKGLYGTEYDRLAAVGHEPRFLASDAVGKWIVWNVLGRAPQTKDECLLVRATGAMVTSAFFDWWRA